MILAAIVALLSMSSCVQSEDKPETPSKTEGELIQRYEYLNVNCYLLVSSSEYAPACYHVANYVTEFRNIDRNGNYFSTLELQTYTTLRYFGYYEKNLVFAKWYDYTPDLGVVIE